ncbi:hypothetical protein PDIG_27120 [Penicillium digitatum PHI26]|uniref:Peptidase A1 domain-containing protein n=2 Tax=Penicillium digitatum TaxID=36651 RepID=K9G1Q7_PEND2|nr:hypothetical protein PDIP_61560 [Penicillium digitatum Pd1]EKV10018.1 hypothetical protein PDIP_61560 [Penicillium digitatum Pd1]EKV15274.1 hypothetical protein PDIG_27120 [Penicillium digitatum PHI26]
MMNLFGTDIPSSNLITVEDGYQTYPGGQNYPLEVGTLALGAQYVNQTFGDVGGNLITGWLWNGSQTIQSNTYGMHIGFFALGIPGSLMLGGYDQSRVLGDVSVQPHTGSSAPINLLDVSLGVATGGSPWNSTSKENLLAQGNSSLLGGTTVIAAPVDPYLYLPQSSCDAIAAELPVTHNSDLGLYAWNTDDPQYQRTYSQKTLPRWLVHMTVGKRAGLRIGPHSHLTAQTAETAKPRRQLVPQPPSHPKALTAKAFHGAPKSGLVLAVALLVSCLLSFLCFGSFVGSGGRNLIPLKIPLLVMH